MTPSCSSLSSSRSTPGWRPRGVFSLDIVEERPGLLVFHVAGKNAWETFKDEPGGHRCTAHVDALMIESSPWTTPRGDFDEMAPEVSGVATKQCSKCRVEKLVADFSSELKRGVYRPRSDCKQCRSTRRSRMVQRRRAESPHEIWAVLAGGWARARAKAQKLPVDLPRETVLRIIEQANGHCTYCRRAIDFQCSIHTRQAGPSLDRLVPELGYVESNLVLACYRCNAIKGDASPDELLNIANVARALIEARGAE